LSASIFSFDCLSVVVKMQRYPLTAFDDRAARLQLSGAFGILDHLDRNAVLDRVAGVERLELDEHVRVGHAARNGIDTHHRRMSDGVKNAVADLRSGCAGHV
jgi:hypothetical protein